MLPFSTVFRRGLYNRRTGSPTSQTVDDLMLVGTESAVHPAVDASGFLQIGNGRRVAGNDARSRRRLGKSSVPNRRPTSYRRSHLPVVPRPDVRNEFESVQLRDGRRVSAEVGHRSHRRVRERGRHRGYYSVVDVERSVFGKRYSGRFCSGRSCRFDPGSGCVHSTTGSVCYGVVHVDYFSVKVVVFVVVVVVVVVVAVSAVKGSAFGHHLVRVVAGPDPVHLLRQISVDAKLRKIILRQIAVNSSDTNANRRKQQTKNFL